MFKNNILGQKQIDDYLVPIKKITSIMQNLGALKH